MTQPTPPIELTGTGEHLTAPAAPLPDDLAARLGGICDTVVDVAELAEASRDWWPLALHWSIAGETPKRAAVLVRPTATEEVSGVLAACNEARVPVTAAGGRSGVCGASVPVFGGVLLDLTGLDSIGSVDEASGIVEVAAGVFGPDLERVINTHHGLTVGHFPQSFDLATVGGWVACRGAGQYSTRYGKIEDMVVGLELVLADGRVVRTGGAPAAAVGPDLTQLFVGSEGTLGVITRVWLRAHPVPPAQRRAAYRFDTLSAGFEACRRILRRGATPAVLRLYDGVESARGHGGDGTDCALLVLDEGDEAIVDAAMSVVDEVCLDLGTAADESLVADWIEHRNDTSALQDLTRRGFVVDTMEIAAPWSALDAVYEAATTALMAVPHAVVASCHLSHSYVDGACLYFTFAATPPADEIESTYVALWDAGQRAILGAGGNLSHHHGVGLNRARFVENALGPAFDVLVGLKQTLDPAGILNPGKLGLPGPFGAPSWP
ncbi:MAG: FAD-binding oxidoreductase [Ilumatobacter sp.]|uniref:FAD-binding oxidoreductase n=1 Tax=Ilumatobacter sp. TaxID=1967498 RepID=UPI00260A1150|nr:FAD-binding oxidoreductase [Ilumatobacter sp.]MDJ0767872.1 FAD-binding oxidoreductase [Ilumatobacter sp.]